MKWRLKLSERQKKWAFWIGLPLFGVLMFLIFLYATLPLGRFVSMAEASASRAGYDLEIGDISRGIIPGDIHLADVKLVKRQVLPTDKPFRIVFDSIDVDVALKSGMRATVRRPDVVVLSVENYGDGDRRLDAADVLLVVEVVSPGSERTDRVVKPAEYARAGIAHYWLVELGDPFSLTAFELVDDVYKHVEGGTGTVELTRPVPLTFDLDALLRRR